MIDFNAPFVIDDQVAIVFGSVADTVTEPSRERTRAFLADLMARRGCQSPGHNPIWFLERWGATIIQPTAFEPDPTTYRGDYYYNAVTNTLYRKVVTRREPGIVVAHWQKASE